MTILPMSYFEFDKEAEPEIIMPQKQRAIVDALFEESHYESGIQALDRLRSPRYLPTIAHIRQLIYMSLYPPEEIVDIPVTASPRKLQQHRQKRARMPSEEASRRATNLLCAFVRTNGPHALFQAIPHYRHSGSKGVTFADAADMDETVNQDMEDSPIGRDARVVGQVKDCWALVEPNVVRRKGRPAPDDEDSTDDELTNMTSVVGNDSWSLLEVFVDAFEEDEKRHRNRSGRLFSPTLLTHIPRVRLPQPWNVERPVNVIFSSILSSPAAPGQPYHPDRAQLGTRLLALIVNATLMNSKFASSAGAIVQLCVKLIMQPYCLLQHLQYLLMNLSSFPQYDVFVVALVCGLLEGSVVVQRYGQEDDDPLSSRPAPKAKPRQRLPGTGPQPAIADSVSGQQAPRGPYALPSLNTVLRHLASSSVTPQPAKLSAGPSPERITPARLEVDAQKSAVAKMHLLQSLSRIMSAQPPPNEGHGSVSQAEWRDALMIGKVRRAVETGFHHVAGLESDSEFKAFIAPTCLQVVEDLEGIDAVATSTQDVMMQDQA